MKDNKNVNIEIIKVDLLRIDWTNKKNTDSKRKPPAWTYIAGIQDSKTISIPINLRGLFFKYKPINIDETITYIKPYSAKKAINIEKTKII